MPNPILLVEDDENTRTALADVLEMKGYAVAQASLGAEALDYLRAGKPACLIILDMTLPDMSGADVHAELRRDSALSKIPVIVFSGYENDGRLTDVVAYVRKGIDPDDLLRVVDGACGNPA
jgi:CheY-like chemotaxis protein